MTSEFEEIRPEDLKRFHGTKLTAKRVELASPVQIKGDKERREQMDAMLEEMVEDRLRRAAEKALAIEDEAASLAEKIVADATAQAQQLLDAAIAQENEIKEKAYNEGFEAGFGTGRSEATQKVETETVQLLAGAQTLVEGSYQAEKQVLNNFQHHALEIIRHVCRSVIKKELDVSPEVMLLMVQQAVDDLYLTGKVKIVVGEETLQDIRNFTQGSAEALSALTRFEFTADARLGRQDVFVLGESASYDVSANAQIEQRLAPLADNLPLEATETDQPEEDLSP